MLDGRDKDFSRLVETVAGVQQGIDTHLVPAPRLDLVEVAPVGIVRIVGFFVEQIVTSLEDRQGKRKPRALGEERRGAERQYASR
jgi:hypothetical protein